MIIFIVNVPVFKAERLNGTQIQCMFDEYFHKGPIFTFLNVEFFLSIFVKEDFIEII